MTASLFVTARGGGEAAGRWAPVGRLDHEDGLYRFRYTCGAAELEAFEPFVGMSDLHGVYESDELLPLFSNRLLGRSRPEYPDYLRWSGFDPKSPPDAIALLGVTEGRRATDAIEVFAAPMPEPDGTYLSTFFVHGMRWLSSERQSEIARLTTGTQLHLMHEVANTHDPNAMMVLRAANDPTTKVGYVPRYLAPDIQSLLANARAEAPSITVVRVNTDAPLQHRVLCRARLKGPAGFRPFAAPAFALLNGE